MFVAFVYSAFTSSSCVVAQLSFFSSVSQFVVYETHPNDTCSNGVIVHCLVNPHAQFRQIRADLSGSHRSLWTLLLLLLFSFFFGWRYHSFVLSSVCILILLFIRYGHNPFIRDLCCVFQICLFVFSVIRVVFCNSIHFRSISSKRGKEYHIPEALSSCQLYQSPRPPITLPQGIWRLGKRDEKGRSSPLRLCGRQRNRRF